jgi:hypothetical protein
VSNEHNVCSFSGHDGKTESLRFFRGSREGIINPEEIEDQSRAASLQHRLGTAAVSKLAPKSINRVVDVSEIVANF